MNLSSILEETHVFDKNFQILSITRIFHEKKFFQENWGSSKQPIFLLKNHVFGFWSTNFDENLPTRWHVGGTLPLAPLNGHYCCNLSATYKQINTGLLVLHGHAVCRVVYWAPKKSFAWIMKIPDFFLTFFKFQKNFLTFSDFSWLSIKTWLFPDFSWLYEPCYFSFKTIIFFKFSCKIWSCLVIWKLEK